MVERLRTGKLIIPSQLQEIQGVTAELIEKEEEKIRKNTTVKIEEILRNSKQRHQEIKTVSANGSIDQLLRNARAIAKTEGSQNTQSTVTTSTNAPDKTVAKTIVIETKKVEKTALQTMSPTVATLEETVEEYALYKVKSGDFLIRIAKSHDMTLAELKELNNIKGSVIRVGQKLKVVSKGKKLNCEPIQLASLSAMAPNPSNKGEIVNIAKTKSKKKTISSKIGSVVKKASSSKRIFNWPLRGRITSKYGMRVHPVHNRWSMHSGVDLAAGKGTSIRSVADGTVKFAGWMGGYGRLVIIKHANGFESRYAHCSRLKVRKGQSVSKGKIIAASGSTGTATGPHLHFEIRKSGKHVNPMLYLKK
jgi:murein DD-endopeptidase MepM/ murein hydrolase activator NlpD